MTLVLFPKSSIMQSRNFWGGFPIITCVKRELHAERNLSKVLVCSVAFLRAWLHAREIGIHDHVRRLLHCVTNSVSRPGI